MEWSEHTVEVAVGSVVVAALIITFLVKNRLVTFGKGEKRNSYVDKNFCSNRVEKCMVDKKESDKVLHAIKEAIVLQTHIVDQHDIKFDKFEKTISSIRCDIKNMWKDVEIIKDRNTQKDA